MDYGDRNANNLLPAALKAALPELYSQENVADPIVHAKFFTPDAGATWLILEGSQQPDDDPAYHGDTLFFCFACLGPHMRDCAELGYVSLSELQELRGKLDLPVERDLWWTPKPLSQAKREEFGIE